VLQIRKNNSDFAQAITLGARLRQRIYASMVGALLGALIWGLGFLLLALLEFMEDQYEFFGRWTPWLLRMMPDVNDVWQHHLRKVLSLNPEPHVFSAILLYAAVGGGLAWLPVPRLQRRYSLRALLAAMTISALVLGAIMAVLR
jgi:hypothetical protein